MDSILNYKERMKHEFDLTPPSVAAEGYKVDGDNGIKKACKLEQIKSVDYFYSNGNFKLIEFSDLAKQRAANLDEIQAVKSSSLDKKTIRNFHKEKAAEIQRELIQKYKDSLHIAQRMNNYLKDVPDVFSHNKGHFIIVVAAVDVNLNPGIKVEVMRFLDVLGAKISSAIPKDMHNRVTVIPLHRFMEELN